MNTLDFNFDPSSLLPDRRQLQLKCADYLASSALKRNVQINRNEQGAPYLPDANSYISISHTGNWMSVIINEQSPSAIDIEFIHRQVGSVKSKFTTSAEISMVKDVFGLNPEIFIWCCKECLFKMLPFEGIHFKEQLLFVGVNKSDGGDHLSTIWSVKHENFNGQYLVNSFIFEGLLISYIDENGHLSTD